MEASGSPWALASPLRQGRFEVVLPVSVSTPIPYVFFSFLFWFSLPRNAAKNMGDILRHIIDFAFEKHVHQVSPFLSWSAEEMNTGGSGR